MHQIKKLKTFISDISSQLLATGFCMIAGIILLVVLLFSQINTNAIGAVKPKSEKPQAVNPEKTRWDEYKTKIAEEVTKYQYSNAITLLDNFLKSIKSEEIIKGINGYIEDIKGEQSLFNNVIKDLTGGPTRKKIVIGDRDIWINKVDETGFEGTMAGMSGSVYTRRWRDIPQETVFELFSKDLPKLERFYSAIFCYNHGLPEEGEQILIYCLRTYLDEKWRVDRALCRYKNIPLPEGGFFEYQGQLVTAEEKSYLEKGYVKYQGKWMSYDEMMAAKGLIKFQDRWMTPEQKAKIEERLAALTTLRNTLAPKGVIDKPGADKEQLPWDKARTKDTDHYTITTNLSQEALADLCYLMECYYFEAKKIFKISRDPGGKLKVSVYKNQKEYKAAGGPGQGVYMASGANKRIMAYYIPSQGFNTSTVLLHEGTHQFVDLVCTASVPIWINEGLATYYESSKFEGTSLKTNLVNKGRLGTIQDMIRKKNVARLGDFINIKQANFAVPQYAHVWSLVYFFVNYNSGQYADELETYFTGIKKGKGGDPKQHKKLFEESFKVKFETLESQWEKYILNLK